MTKVCSHFRFILTTRALLSNGGEILGVGHELFFLSAGVGRADHEFDYVAKLAFRVFVDVVKDEKGVLKFHFIEGVNIPPFAAPEVGYQEFGGSSFEKMGIEVFGDGDDIDSESCHGGGWDRG